MQDEITQKIVFALKVTLTPEEQERFQRFPTDNLEAYDIFLHAWEAYQHSTKETNLQARQLLERATALDPQYAAAYAALGWTYFQEWVFQWSQDSQSLEQAFELAQKALALDDSTPHAHHLLGTVHSWQKQYDQAITRAERTLALDPNNADGYSNLAEILTWAGRPEEVLELVKKAMRLNPYYPIWYLWNLGHAYYLTGQYEEAIITLKRALSHNPDHLPSHAYLAVIYSELGQEEGAQAAEAECRRLSPHASLEVFRQRLPYKDQAVSERVFNALSKVWSK